MAPYHLSSPKSIPRHSIFRLYCHRNNDFRSKHMSYDRQLSFMIASGCVSPPCPLWYLSEQNFLGSSPAFHKYLNRLFLRAICSRYNCGSRKSPSSLAFAIIPDDVRRDPTIVPILIWAAEDLLCLELSFHPSFKSIKKHCKIFVFPLFTAFSNNPQQSSWFPEQKSPLG